MTAAAPDPRPDRTRATLIERLLALAQYPLPQHGLSRLVHRLARVRLPVLRGLLIRAFVRRFGVDLSEAAEPEPGAYPHFNAFFTRALRAGLRPLPDDPGALACPVDGSVSQAGHIRAGRVFQAKGRSFTVTELLGGDADAARDFEDGGFATLYLSPRDYHRVHMPLDGRLTTMTHIPGRLFSVNPATTRAVPRLFARNERVVCLFDTARGPAAVVLVGAMLVAGIETVWAGEITPPRGRRIRRWDYGTDGPAFRRGEEIGRFNMGSTVILLLPRDTVSWSHALQPEAQVRMGQPIGTLSPVSADTREPAKHANTRE